MKNIILPFVLLFSIYGFGQNKIEITKEGLTNTTQIIALDSLSAKEIYSRINKYIQKNYSNPDKVAKGNIENEFVSFNGVIKDPIFYKSFGKERVIDCLIEYYFNIDIKKGKIKLTISKLLETSPDIEGSIGLNIDLLAIKPMLKSNYAETEQVLKIRHDKEKAINDLVENFVSSIKETKKSDW